MRPRPGAPKRLRATSTASIVETTGAPTDAFVTPSSASDCHLPVRRRSTVAAHAGDQVRLSARPPDRAGKRGEQRNEVSDPAAPDADGDAVALRDPVLEPGRREQLLFVSRDVVQARSLDDLSHAQQVRELGVSGRHVHG